MTCRAKARQENAPKCQCRHLDWTVVTISVSYCEPPKPVRPMQIVLDAIWYYTSPLTAVGVAEVAASSNRRSFSFIRFPLSGVRDTRAVSASMSFKVAICFSMAPSGIDENAAHSSAGRYKRDATCGQRLLQIGGSVAATFD